MSPEEDRQLASLMDRAQAGDEKAYESLLTAVEIIVRNYVSRRLATVDAVDDVVQEILLSLHKARHTFDPTRPFGPWLYAIAHFRLTDHMRQLYLKMKREIENEALLENRGGEAEFGPMGGVDVDQLLATLPEKQRDVIRLLKIEELSVKEVAEQMGLSESDIKVSAHRGLKNLRMHLGGQRGDKQTDQISGK